MTISYTNRPRTSDVNGEKLSYKKVPGPGTYESLEMTPASGRPNLSKNKRVRMSVINKDIRFKPIKSVSPGPNMYNSIDDLNRNSKYFSSRRKGEGTRPFDQEEKFTHRYWRSWRDNLKPGPGSHLMPSDFGQYGNHEYNKTLCLMSR